MIKNTKIQAFSAGLIIPLLCVVIFTATLQFLPTNWQNQIRYSPAAFDQYQIWRIFSGHFIHLGWEHWILNISGLIMITLLFPEEIKPPLRLLLFYLFSCLFISICFRIYSPELIWYVGLSGVLHALMVFCILSNLPQYKATNLLLLSAIIAKVIHEIFVGPGETTSAFIKGNIVYQAHGYGVIAGLIYFLLCLGLRKLRKNSNYQPTSKIDDVL